MNFFKKFTFIDVVIVLIIVAIVAGGVYYLQSKNIIQTGPQNHTFSYELCFSNIPQNVVDEMDVGDIVYDSAKKAELGTVDKIEKEPYREVFPDTVNGSYVTKTVPNRYRVILHVTTDKATVNGDDISIDNFEVYLGKSCYIRSSNYTSTAVVWSLDTKEAK